MSFKVNSFKITDYHTVDICMFGEQDMQCILRICINHKSNIIRIMTVRTVNEKMIKNENKGLKCLV